MRQGWNNVVYNRQGVWLPANCQLLDARNCRCRLVSRIVNKHKGCNTLLSVRRRSAPGLKNGWRMIISIKWLHCTLMDISVSPVCHQRFSAEISGKKRFLMLLLADGQWLIANGWSSILTLLVTHSAMKLVGKSCVGGIKDKSLEISRISVISGKGFGFLAEY